METTILYPFSITADNKSTFLQTLQLAQKLAAEVVCFTSVSEEEKLEEAYLHLLQLNGHFQSTVHKWQQIEVKIKRAVKVGFLKTELALYLQEAAVDLVICQPQSKHLEESILSDIISKNDGSPQLLTFKLDE